MVLSRKVLTCTKSSTVILSKPFSFTTSLQAIFTCAMCIFFFLANIQTRQYMYSVHRKCTHHHSHLSCSSCVTCPFPCQQLIATLRIVDSVCVCALSRYLANLAIWLRATNMPEWGIPEKNIKNVAQRR